MSVAENFLAYACLACFAAFIVVGFIVTNSLDIRDAVRGRTA